MNPLPVCKSARLLWKQAECGLLASAAAYNGVLSLVPLLALSVGAMGYVVHGSDAAQRQVLGALGQYLPIRASELAPVIQHISARRGWFTVLGAVGFIYGGSGVFVVLSRALTRIARVAERRSWLRIRATAAVCACAAVLLLMGSTATGFVLGWLVSRPVPLVPVTWHRIAGRVILAASPVAVTTLLFYVLYLVLPARRPHYRHAMAGALVAAMAWEFAKYAFGYAVVVVNTYNRLYGSLSGAAILAVWAYYTCATFLLGATLAAASGEDAGEQGGAAQAGSG